MNHSCEYDRLLCAYLDDELAEDQMARIKAHIETCAACSREIQLLRQADQIIRELPEMKPSRNFEAVFWDKVAKNEISLTDRILSGLAWFFSRRMALVTVTAMTVGVVFLGLRLWTPSSLAPTAEEIVIAENLELLQDLQAVHHLELLENWETIVSLDERS